MPRFVLFRPTASAFAARAVLSILLLGGASLTEWFDAWVGRPLMLANAWATSAILEAIGVPCVRLGTSVHAPAPNPFSIEVIPECTGIYILVILVSLTLAFPASWKRHATGLVVGVLLVALLNLARLVTIFLVGRVNPELFKEIHEYVWQTFFLLVVLVFWYLWASRLGAPRAAGPQGEASP